MHAYRRRSYGCGPAHKYLSLARLQFTHMHTHAHTRAATHPRTLAPVHPCTHAPTHAQSHIDHIPFAPPPAHPAEHSHTIPVTVFLHRQCFRMQCSAMTRRKCTLTWPAFTSARPRSPRPIASTASSAKSSTATRCPGSGTASSRCVRASMGRLGRYAVNEHGWRLMHACTNFAGMNGCAPSDITNRQTDKQTNKQQSLTHSLRHPHL